MIWVLVFIVAGAPVYPTGSPAIGVAYFHSAASCQQAAEALAKKGIWQGMCFEDAPAAK